MKIERGDRVRIKGFAKLREVTFIDKELGMIWSRLHGCDTEYCRPICWVEEVIHTVDPRVEATV